MTKSRLRILLPHFILGAVLIAPGKAVPADWPQFRGPNSSGIASGPAPPVEFGPGKNEKWKLSVGAGHSSPCIVGNALYLTTFDRDSKTLAVVCIDRQQGRIRWERRLEVEGLEKGHPSFNPASSSPTADAEQVVAYFGSFGLISFDTQGNKLWERRMPMTKSYAGNATSPAIIGNKVILYRGNYVDHFLLAIDKTTGKDIWSVAQDETFTGELACTSCPVIAGQKLIVHTARSVQAFDIETGKQIWVARCATTATSSPVLTDKEVIVAAWNKMGEPALRPTFPTYEELVKQHDKDGNAVISRSELPKLWIFHRPDGAEAPQNGATMRFDQVDRDRNKQISSEEWSQALKGIEEFRARYKQHGMLAIPIDSQGELTSDDVRTIEKQSIPEVPSPLTDGDRVYFVKNGGILTCVDLKTGRRIYRKRTGADGTHYASPFIAGDRIYTVSGAGQITVLSLGPKPQILAKNDMQDQVYASPAVVDGTIYVRTHTTLYAFGN